MSNEAHNDLIGLQNALLKTDNVEQFLHELAVLSTRVVTDGLSCGMTFRPRGRMPITAACTDPLAAEADDVQYRTGDGPCLHALRHAQPVRIDDMATHGRWPRFARQATDRACTRYAMPRSYTSTTWPGTGSGRALPGRRCRSASARASLCP